MAEVDGGGAAIIFVTVFRVARAVGPSHMASGPMMPLLASSSGAQALTSGDDPCSAMPQRALPQQSGDASWPPSHQRSGDGPWMSTGSRESLSNACSAPLGRGTQQSVAQPGERTLSASASLRTEADAGPLQQTQAAAPADTCGLPRDEGEDSTAVKRSAKRKVWTFVTCNANSGATGEALLSLKRMRRADVWMWQEHKYNRARCSDARARLRATGRAAFLAPDRKSVV